MPGVTKHSQTHGRPATSAARRQRGAATLVVVMVLFFLLTLVAGYTSRNLIFEQRTSANQYRSTQALEAADAGVEWALALLNAGRIDDKCAPTADNSLPSFRDRYLQDIDDAGRITIRNTGGAPLMAVCVYDKDADSGDGGWACDCAADAAPTLPTVAGDAAKPMFRVRFEYPAAGVDRNVLFLVSAGCTRPDASCMQPVPVAPGGDALAVVRALITLRSALTTPPGAPLTTLGDVNGVGTLSIINLDAATLGMTVIAGGTISGVPALTTLPGTPGSASVGDADSFLQSLSNTVYSSASPSLTAEDLMFHSVLSMAPATYRDQPGAVRLNCSGGCNATSLSAAATANPGRSLWVEGGDVDINGNIGTAVAPVVLLLDTDTAAVTFSSGTVYGLVHVRKDALNLGAGSTSLQGALVVEGALTGAGNQLLIYNPEVLNRLRVASGSFVRVPGGWRDY